MADVLLVGGSHNGQSIQTRLGSMPMAVRMPSALAFSMNTDDWDPTQTLPVETYTIVRLVLFGRTVYVGLAPGVTPDLAVPSMLSPAAFALWAQAEA